MPTQSTITEALAELKVIDKRIEAKRQFIGANIMRPEQLKDPFEKDGGSVTALAKELQAVGDLEERKVSIRRAIQQANEATSVTVGKVTRSVADWLVWRRDVAPQQQSFLTQMRTGIDNNRKQALQRGQTLATADAVKPGDIIVNVNELELASQLEELGATLETLDGQLSLKNATVPITY